MASKKGTTKKKEGKVTKKNSKPEAVIEKIEETEVKENIEITIPSEENIVETQDIVTEEVNTEESVAEVSNEVSEEKKDSKNKLEDMKIISKVPDTFGYSWNGQEFEW